MIKRLPEWFKQPLPDEAAFKIKQQLSDSCVHTVCQEAHCPNISRCFSNNELTFLILGPTCTRNCTFCAVDKSKLKDIPINKNEHRVVASFVLRFKLTYAVITSVTRDDLFDGGANAFVQTVEEIRNLSPMTEIEVLTPDFGGCTSSIFKVAEASPSVFGHNLETVKRIYPQIRPEADYLRSLKLLKEVKIHYPSLITKSSLMVGLGESNLELEKALCDLIDCNCDIVTIGQYLAPSLNHYPVEEYIREEVFLQYKEFAQKLGFKAVSSGPLVRSSYQAGQLFKQVREFSYA